MSDIRKWLKIMESVPAVFPDQPEKQVMFKKDATVMVDPKFGGGTGRFMHSTPNGAMIDIKGIARELSADGFSAPERDYEDPYQKGNDWFHMSQEPDSIGTQRDKPEFRPGDMVKIADVYGAVIGPGFGVFVGYGTTGQDCIVSFDNKEIIVPVANVAAVLEQDAKDNFGEMDNDGNLSPMSLGSDNVKIEQPQNVGMQSREPAMDQRDEFSKWIGAVEEALNTESVQEIAEVVPSHVCGCGSWDCPECFPENNPQMAEPEMDMMGGAPEACPTCGHEMGHEEHGCGQPGELEIELPLMGAVDEDDDAIADFYAKGGKPTTGKYHGPRKSEVTFPGSAHIGGSGDKMTSSRTGHAANTQGLPVVGMKKKAVDEEDQEFTEKPKSGKGVKIGHLVIRSDMKSKSSGQNSPMTYGDDNLDEDDGWYDPSQDDLSTPDMDDEVARGEYNKEMAHPSMNGDDALALADQIQYMQDLGLSKSSKMYHPNELMSMDPTQLTKVHGEVMGTVSEESKPTKTKQDVGFDFDDMDILGNKNLPAVVDEPESEPDASAGSMSLPKASAASTAKKTAGIGNSASMRDMMNMINPEAGAGEPDLEPEVPGTEVALVTGADVPAVVSNAMQAAGVQSPEWHDVSHLPGFMQKNIRGMGRQVFSMFTRTPLEQIQTIANVDGKGPNTDAELRAVGSWLQQNAEDLGKVDLSHGMAIPGYKPDVKEFRANGVRFHVVRDPVGQYIYAYPDQDAVTPGAPSIPNQGGGVPRLTEAQTFLKATLFEKIKFGAELDEAFIEESSLSKLIGKKTGGQNLVRWLHKRHRLDNDADLQPLKVTNADIHRPLWTEFKKNGDNFVVVSAANGVAAIKPYTKYIQDRTAEFAKKGKTYNPAGDNTIPYQIIAFTDDGTQIDPELLKPEEKDPEKSGRFGDPTVSKARMGKIANKDIQNSDNAFDLLAAQIGRLQTIWVTGVEDRPDDEEIGSINRKGWRKGAVPHDKMNKRADMKKTPEMDERTALDTIFKRVRPVLKKLGNQAVLQINNRVKRYIDGGNFEGAKDLSEKAIKLKNFLATIDTSGDVAMAGPLFQQLRKALADAAKSYVGSDEYKAFIQDIANGNSAALGPVLDSLRDNLVQLA